MSDVYNDLMKRYVDLLALSLTGALYEDPALIACGTDVYDENLRLSWGRLAIHSLDHDWSETPRQRR